VPEQRQLALPLGGRFQQLEAEQLVGAALGTPPPSPACGYRTAQQA
jgi:hypothetical protein